MRKNSTDTSLSFVFLELWDGMNMLGLCSSRAIGSGRSDSAYSASELMSSGVSKTVGSS